MLQKRIWTINDWTRPGLWRVQRPAARSLVLVSAPPAVAASRNLLAWRCRASPGVFGAVAAVDGLSSAIGRDVLRPAQARRLRQDDAAADDRRLSGAGRGGHPPSGGRAAGGVQHHKGPANMVFRADHPLPPPLPSRETFASASPIRGWRGRSGRRRRWRRALARGLDGLGARRPDQLEQQPRRQRYPVARAGARPRGAAARRARKTLDPNLRREVQLELKGLPQPRARHQLRLRGQRPRGGAGDGDFLAVMNTRAGSSRWGTPAAVFEAPETRVHRPLPGPHTQSFTAAVRGCREESFRGARTPTPSPCRTPGGGARGSAACGPRSSPCTIPPPPRVPLPVTVEEHSTHGAKHRVDRPRAGGRALHRPRPERRRGAPLRGRQPGVPGLGGAAQRAAAGASR